LGTRSLDVRVDSAVGVSHAANEFPHGYQCTSFKNMQDRLEGLAVSIPTPVFGGKFARWSRT
jgi:hypothetical protein